MRRFDILLDGVVVGEGVERCGNVWCWTSRDEARMAPGRLEFWANREQLEIRYLDPPPGTDPRETNPPAGWTGGGEPVYSAERPGPREGKLPSERIDDIAERAHAAIVGGVEVTYESVQIAAIKRYLDERLGRAPKDGA